MIKHYKCLKCGNITSAEGLIPECKCTHPKTMMEEITSNHKKARVKK